MLLAPPVVILRNYLRGTSDLVTSHNLFLIGCSNFFGIAALGSGLTGLLHNNPTMGDVLLFIFATALFFGCLHWAYRKWEFPRKVALKHWRTSPPVEFSPILVAALLTMLFGAFASFLPVQIPVIGQTTNVLGKLLPAAGVALLFAAWLRTPINAVYLFGAGFMLVYGTFVALFGAGRHPLLAVLAAGPITMYWMRWRYKPPTATIGIMLGLGVAAFFLILVYSTFRHDFMGEADAAVAADRFKQLLEFDFHMTSEVEGLLQDESVAAGLLCVEKFHRAGSPEYFHTFKYILSNPIPRDWWPNKPQALGEYLPESLGEFSDGYVNWGTSIIGNAFHDGGVWMAAVYGLILGFFFRVFDDIMARQPLNPWPIAILTAVSSKLIGFSRGDINVYSIEIIGILVISMLGLWILKSIFGSVPEEMFHLPSDGEDDEGGYEEHDPHLEYEEHDGFEEYEEYEECGEYGEENDFRERLT